MIEGLIRGRPAYSTVYPLGGRFVNLFSGESAHIAIENYKLWLDICNQSSWVNASLTAPPDKPLRFRIALYRGIRALR